MLMEKLLITPKTKIYDLLEAYPELEDTLIGSAPEFKKLQNPMLRKTITRITSIGQAATIGGLNVEDLVNKLRTKVGQSSIEQLNDSGTKFTTEKPEWFNENKVVERIDTREMLNKGEHPVHVVLAAAKKLNDDEILEITTPFIPAPLIDKAVSLEFKHWLEKVSEGEFRVYFSK